MYTKYICMYITLAYANGTMGVVVQSNLRQYNCEAS